MGETSVTQHEVEVEVIERGGQGGYDQSQDERQKKDMRRTKKELHGKKENVR